MNNVNERIWKANLEVTGDDIMNAIDIDTWDATRRTTRGATWDVTFPINDIYSSLENICYDCER